MPESLEATYKDALQRIPKQDAKMARLILMWLTSSLRPLTLNEIAAAVSVPRPEFVLRICSSILVTLIHEDTNESIKIAHFSVKEYLFKAEEERKKRSRGRRKEGTEADKEFSWYQFTNKLAQATIADATVSYLLKTNSTNISEQMAIDEPLLPYSSQYWYQHTAAVIDEMADFPQLREKINKIFSLEYSQSYLNCLRAYHYDRHYGYIDDSGYHFSYNDDERTNYITTIESFPRPLYYASMLGL